MPTSPLPELQAAQNREEFLLFVGKRRKRMRDYSRKPKEFSLVFPKSIRAGYLGAYKSCNIPGLRAPSSAETAAVTTSIGNSTLNTL